MRVCLLFHLQTKGKGQTSAASDIEKYLLKAQIQDWRNFDLQRYKVRRRKLASASGSLQHPRVVFSVKGICSDSVLTCPSKRCVFDHLTNSDFQFK